MPLRTRLFIIISVVALLILGISVFLLIKGKKPTAPSSTAITPGTTNVTGNQPAGHAPGLVSGLPIKPMTSAQIEENAIKQLAKIFVERYNTYSSDNAYQNIRDVQALVSAAFWKKLSARLQAPAPTSTAFLGVTTEAVVANVTALTDSAATVVIKTRRTTTQNSVAAVSYLDLLVNLIKSNGAWQVDSQTSK